MPDDQFEQPDLRTKARAGGFSVYKHPHSGVEVPSVTTISGLIDKSGYLGPWHRNLAAQWAAANLPLLVSTFDHTQDLDAVIDLIKAGAKRMSEVARNRGSLAHNAIEALCRGEQPEIDEVIRPHVEAWQEFMHHYVNRIIMLEETVWSHQYLYAGTMDVIFEFHNGDHVLVDYKTGKDVHADAAMQLAAIMKADVVITTQGEFPMPRIDYGGILHLPAPVLTPTGKPSVRGKWSFREYRFRDADWDTFRALRRAHYWEHNESSMALGGKQTRPSWT